jgi:hypothetical protein
MKTLLPKSRLCQPAGFTATAPAPPSGVPPNLRRLESNERVRPGDFEEDGSQGFKPWDGPPGFRADAFVKTIYRRQAPSLPEAGKCS